MAATANKPRRFGSGAARHGGAFSVLLLALYAGQAGALDWKFTPSVGARAIYTDNSNQSHNDPQEALILSVTPGFSLQSQGSRRVQASLQYGLNGVSRFGSNQSDDLYHNLNAAGKAELVKDLLFIDGNARISQELISLQGSPADATTNNSNRTTVGTYSISPYVQKRLGTFAFAQARYTASGAIFQNNVASNSNSNSFAAGLSSGTRFTDLSWGLNYSIRKTQNNNAIDTTFESTSATAGYALTRHVRVFGTVGQDSNDYLSRTGTSGSFYSAGFGWAPSRLTSVEASAGERYFGRTYSFSGSHRTRLTNWTLRYSEDVSDISRLTTNYNDLRGAQLVCPAGAAALLPPNPNLLDYLNAGCTVNSLLFGSSVVNGVFISKLLTGGVSWQLGKADVSVTLSDLTRDYQLVQAQDRVQRISGSVQYHLAPTITVLSNLSFVRNNSDRALTGGVAQVDDIVFFDVGINRRFTDKLDGALTFRHTQRDSNVTSAIYDENSIMASANMRF